MVEFPGCDNSKNSRGINLSVQASALVASAIDFVVVIFHTCEPDGAYFGCFYVFAMPGPFNKYTSQVIKACAGSEKHSALRIIIITFSVVGGALICRVGGWR